MYTGAPISIRKYGMDKITVLIVTNAKMPMPRLPQEVPEDIEFIQGDSLESLGEAAPRADVIFSWFGRRELLRRIWKSAPRVRWMHSITAGLEHLLFPELVESTVPLTNGRGVFSQSLGEFVIAAVLFFAKNLRRMVRAQANGIWEPFDLEMVSGKTMGIIGYGDIGRAIARRAKALEMRVIAIRRRPELSRGDPYADEVLPVEKKLVLMSHSDYVAVATPLVQDTNDLIGEAELNAMKPEAVLINVGRGPVVEEAALVRALEERRIRGAALDVFDREPLPRGHAFYRLENVLLSPHCADHIPGWLDDAVALFLQNLERFRRGEPLLSLVDKRLGY